MLEKFSREIAVRLIKSGILENDNSELYGYAIQYLLLIIIPTINFTAYCIATHNNIIGLIILFSFLLIRKYSGGYHCKSSTVCLIFSTIVLIAMVFYANLMNFSPVIIITIILCELELIIKGPIISINHDISDKERIIYRKYLYIILAVYDIIMALFIYFNKIHLACSIAIVIITCSLAHMLCMIGKNKEVYY